MSASNPTGEHGLRIRALALGTCCSMLCAVFERRSMSASNPTGEHAVRLYIFLRESSYMWVQSPS
jgi:hypothetical protein